MDGIWWRVAQVPVVHRISNSVGKLENDARGWVTKAELEKKIGEEAAKSMTAFLESTAPEKCRDHPDAPGIQDTSMDLCTTQKSQSVQSKSTGKLFQSDMESNGPKFPYIALSGVSAVQCADERGDGKPKRRLGAQRYGVQGRKLFRFQP